MIKHMCTQTNNKTMERGKSKMNVEDLFLTLNELNFSKEEILELREKLVKFKEKEAVGGGAG